MLGLILISFSMGLSNFAASIGIGLNGVTHKTRLQVGIIFGIFEAIMPIIGFLIGGNLSKSIDKLGSFIGGGLLILVGIFMIFESTKTKLYKKNNKPKTENNFYKLLITGIAVSIDNLIIGFALSLAHLPIILTVLTITITSISMSLIGLELGNRLGEKVGKWSEKLGGIIMIIIGIFLALGYI